MKTLKNYVHKFTKDTFKSIYKKTKLVLKLFYNSYLTITLSNMIFNPNI